MELINYKINKFNINLIFNPFKKFKWIFIIYIYINYIFVLYLFIKVYNNNIINL